MLLAGKISAVCGKREERGANVGGARNAGVVRGGKRPKKCFGCEGKDILQEIRVAQHVIKLVGSAGK